MQQWSGTFGPKTTADEVVAGLDLSGQLIVVTGANSGIGFHTATALASSGVEAVTAPALALEESLALFHLR